MDKLEVEPYVLAPNVSEEKWEAYEQTLETFGGPQDLGIEPSDGVYAKGLDIGTVMEGPQSITHLSRFLHSGSMAAKL